MISVSPRHSVSASPSPPVSLSLRLGLKYVKGLSEQSGQAIVKARHQQSFTGIDDLHNRVPELRKDELRKLAAVGALNFIQTLAPNKPKRRPREDHRSSTNRRDALWQVERVARDGRGTL